jgi:hypothetical protein
MKPLTERTAALFKEALKRAAAVDHTLTKADGVHPLAVEVSNAVNALLWNIRTQNGSQTAIPVAEDQAIQTITLIAFINAADSLRRAIERPGESVTEAARLYDLLLGVLIKPPLVKDS